ncbi:hypothetical protein B0H67DRAFT_326315 [Lasiosphaeris hirsuta]|uniref:Uncharacterized protein n=1 Tax=Lasiosphaeris hirsuta TaxID=260670 RepID=A0AA40A2C4_9PEZI|nr:hypothetical protein B0H67DRAFT_326315 [Lasiosphaeris hirsuta]
MLMPQVVPNIRRISRFTLRTTILSALACLQTSRTSGEVAVLLFSGVNYPYREHFIGELVFLVLGQLGRARLSTWLWLVFGHGLISVLFGFSPDAPVHCERGGRIFIISALGRSI